MTEHTPGPWTAGKCNPECGCSILAPFKEGDDDVAVASFVTEIDAHLIAAAPDLLEALEEALEWMEGFDQTFLTKEDHTKKHKAVAAIAKARNTPEQEETP